MPAARCRRRPTHSSIFKAQGCCIGAALMGTKTSSHPSEKPQQRTRRSREAYLLARDKRQETHTHTHTHAHTQGTAAQDTEPRTAAASQPAVKVQHLPFYTCPRDLSSGLYTYLVPPRLAACLGTHTNSYPRTKTQQHLLFHLFLLLSARFVIPVSDHLQPTSNTKHHEPPSIIVLALLALRTLYGRT
ncbi:hypothetical protein F4780DRAFT_416554 [Xylariomycetidae sp. FL0641]|nr:hypothetical protein F4780DRAFT_416554 [Xylariomycetidae sp. FL0641]